MSSEKPQEQSQSHDNAQDGHAAPVNGSVNKEEPEQTAKPEHGQPQDKPKEEKKPGESKQPAGGYDASPVPHAPPGYSVRITFHRATKLPMADLSTLSSDPYLTADLTTNLPTRHKEDPNLRFRTHTIWRCLEPAWEEQWIIHHLPASGFKMKLRIYDEDSSDHDDRLGNVHVTVDRLSESWEGIHSQPFKIKKRSGSKRAYFARALAVCFGKAHEMHGEMILSVEVLGKSPGDEGGRAYTYGKNYWCKHYSPLLGRIAGRKDPDGTGQEFPTDASGPDGAAIKPDEMEGKSQALQERTDKLEQSEKDRVGDRTAPKSAHDHGPSAKDKALSKAGKKKQPKKSSQRYNFQANQFQLQGPVPPELYHRYVEFRPFVKSMFTATGVRGIILSKALHHQHMSVYNFNRDTRYGVFESPCADMTLKFLDLAHFDNGGRIFTYVLTLDGLLRFTETGKEFGIDLLSKHTMHSDRSIYIAYSGEFLIRRLKHPHRPSPDAGEGSSRQTGEGEEDNETHPPHTISGGPPKSEAPLDPAYYELVIDNDSGTYRPNAQKLPLLKQFLEKNFPGLKVVTLDCQADEERMSKMKKEQRERKKQEQPHVIYTQISQSSTSLSSDEERLDALAEDEEETSRANQSAEAGAQEGGADDDQPSRVQKHKLGEALAPFAGSHEHIRAALGERQA